MTSRLQNQERESGASLVARGARNRPDTDTAALASQKEAPAGLSHGSARFEARFKTRDDKSRRAALCAKEVAINKFQVEGEIRGASALLAQTFAAKKSTLRGRAIEKICAR